MTNTFPEQFGFIDDLRECIGKTIEKAEIIEMEFGCTWNRAWTIQFTDGTRAFFVGGIGSGIMNPQMDGNYYGALTVEKSEIFTPTEYSLMAEARKRKHQEGLKRLEDKERQELERLKEKYSC